MIKIIKKIVFFSVILFVNVLYAQKTLTVENQKIIIDKLSKEIVNRYYNKKSAQSIAETFTAFLTQTKSVLTTDEFITIVNSHLQKQSRDNHLKIYFDANKFNSYAADEKAKKEFEFKSQKKVNFGFTKVNIIEGNIGYMEIIRFSGFVGEEVAQKIASVMSFVENTNGLIIDLRNNGGGDGRVGEILETYFYPEENEIYYDSISKSEKFRVLPFVYGKRYLNKPVYLLTGLGTFSAAEGFVKRMQKNKKAIVVGEQTKGGGSSGSSVPLSDGFLCFIPTLFGKSDEDASVTPDHFVPEKEALTFAKYLFYKEELMKFTRDDDEKKIVQWSLKTVEYLLHKINTKIISNKEIIGEYDFNIKVFEKNKNLFVFLKNKNYTLIPVDEKEFIIEGFEDSFGAGNRRLLFNDKGFEDIVYWGELFQKRFVKKIN